MAASAAITTTMSQQTILLVDDDDDIRFALTLLLEQAKYRVVEADGPAQCMQLLSRLSPALVLLDMNFTRDTTSGKEGLALLEQITPLNIPVILMTAWANIELAVTGLQKGAKDFIEKPWRKEKLLTQIANHITPLSTQLPQSNWVAQSSCMQSLDTLIKQLAPTDANLLILGENGTGKSQLAKRIHQLSSRCEAPLVNLNMGAIAESLFESELFGHHKGAFTDAKQHRSGAFTRATEGTLFMDEIGTLPLHLQPKLLQVLESGEFTPLGANNNEYVNVRLIAATNQDLTAAIDNGQFRQDLYYRLNTFIIRLPALRERKDDILPLAVYFIEQFADKYNKSPCRLSQGVQDRLLKHRWPGNIRELSHVIERAMLMCTGSIIELSHLILDKPTNQPQFLPQLTLEELEKQRITDALQQHNKQITAAAKSLGISRNALYRRMEKYQLEGVDEQL